jgi:DNA processing protein
MEKSESLFYKLAFALLPGIGYKTGRLLLAEFGSPEYIFREKKSTLLRLNGLGPQTVSAIRGKDAFKKAENEMDFMDRNNIRCFFLTDEGFPNRLKSCPDSPLILFEMGSGRIDASRTLGVVGMRRPSPYGIDMTSTLVKGFEGVDIIINSGLAYGIDTEAHKSAVNAGIYTIAVLAHGLDLIYPYQNKELAKRILLNGSLVTEFPSGTRLNRDLFPRRNRIIAGLSDAILVIESDKKGGALITADIASSYNRDVFAVPGTVGSRASAGTHHLIKSNKAALVENAQDIMYFMSWDEQSNTRGVQKKMFVDLNDEERSVMEYMEEVGEINLDAIYLALKMNPSRISSILLSLEMKGMLKVLPGNRYRIF